jgi:hypothetical protein
VAQRLPPRWSTFIYLGALGTAYAWYLLARQREYQKKHLDYRALAEGLRTQAFWTFAGLGGSVADHYLRKQRSELDWIRQAMRGVDVLSVALASGGRAIESDGALGLVLERWVDDQRSYFARSARRDEERNRVIRRVGYVSFLVGLGLAFLKPFLQTADRVVGLISLGPVVAALFVTYADRMGLSAHAKQYGRMSQLFDNASHALRDRMTAGRIDEARDVLRDLGREALAENGDWVLLHRERPLKVPGHG